MIKTLIVDDHPIIRKGLKQIVEEEGDIVLGEAGNGGEALKKMQAEKWDVVILDISMPERSGLDLLQTMKRQWPERPILILSVHPEDQYAIRTFKAGASGYMTKESASEELIRAIRHIHAGGRYVSAKVGELLAQQLIQGSDLPPHFSLSNRELETVLGIASGKSVSEIAEELALSVKTVSTYRQRALSKMGMTHNSQLIRYVLENNLV